MKFCLFTSFFIYLSTVHNSKALVPKTMVVKAIDYINKFGRLNIGDCPRRTVSVALTSSYRTLDCPYNYKGVESFIQRPTIQIHYKQVKSNSEALDFLEAGGGVGVSYMGLIGGSVSVSVATTVETKRTTLNMMGYVKSIRGMLTMRNPKPIKTLDPNFPTQVYLGNILIGAEEYVLVQLDFQTEARKRVVEVTLSVRILFVKISVKMRFIKKTFGGASKVHIRHISTANNKEETFEYNGLDTFDSAVKKVEELEKHLADLPEVIKRKNRNQLHLEYYFTSWDVVSYLTKLDWNRANFDLRRLTYQISEISSVIAVAEGYLKQELSAGAKGPLHKFKTDMEEKKKKLIDGQRNYFQLPKQKQNDLFKIFGVGHASGYYMRMILRLAPY